MDEMAEHIPTKFKKMTQSRSYSSVVLEAEEKSFAIYIHPFWGKAMQMYLASTVKSRPFTHELMNKVFRGLDIKVRQVVINDFQDTIYFARLFLEQQMGDILNIVEIDARPSDCITFALLHKVPIFCTRDVLEKTIPYAE